MSLIWQDGQLSWAFVGIIVYLTFLLVIADLAWRLTAWGGKRLLLVTLAAAVIGSAWLAAVLA